MSGEERIGRGHGTVSEAFLREIRALAQQLRDHLAEAEVIAAAADIDPQEKAERIDRQLIVVLQKAALVAALADSVADQCETLLPHMAGALRRGTDDLRALLEKVEAL